MGRIAEAEGLAHSEIDLRRRNPHRHGDSAATDRSEAAESEVHRLAERHPPF
jgi:hypothetical protein